MKSDTNRSLAMVIAAWGLALGTTVLAVVVWSQVRLKGGLSGYEMFPLFGLTAFGLMWGHFVVGALRRVFGVSRQPLAWYFRATGWLVLLLILAHPLWSTTLLWLDGFGLPPWSYLAVYSDAAMRLALLAGASALLLFLAYELHRWFKGKPWWRVVEYAQIVAMALIFLHALTLGGELGVGWFRVVWYSYGVTLLVAVTVSIIQKRRGAIMKKSTLYTVLGIIAVAVLAVVVYMLMNSMTSNIEEGQDTGGTSSQSPSESSSNVPGETVTITYTDNGFEPATLNLAVGDTLQVKNDSSSPLQLASDDHPTHTKNPELNIATLQPGESDNIMITQPGEWGVHNHVNPGDTATLTVIE